MTPEDLATLACSAFGLVCPVSFSLGLLVLGMLYGVTLCCSILAVGFENGM